MTYTCYDYESENEEKGKGLLNLWSLLMIGLLIFLFYLGYQNPPNIRTAEGAFSGYILIGGYLSIIPFVVALKNKSSNVKSNWILIGSFILIVMICFALYKYLSLAL